MSRQSAKRFGDRDMLQHIELGALHALSSDNNSRGYRLVSPAAASARLITSAM